MILQHYDSSVGKIPGNKLNTFMECHCKDFPQHYIVMPLAIATSN